MLGRPSPGPSNAHTPIPHGMEQAMTQHLQASLPAHLRQYVGQEHSYVPKHIERELAQHMQTMPDHMKQYAGAYMEQRVLKPAGITPTAAASHLGSHPPVPDQRRLGHSMPVGEQHTVQWALNPQAQPHEPAQLAASQPQPSPATPYQQSPAVPNAPYDFILAPEKPRPQWSLPGGSSLIGRIGLVAGGLVVLLVVFSIIKGILGNNPSVPALINVAQQQQELIHLSTNAQQQQNLSSANTNMAITAQLSLTSDQAQLISYLRRIDGKKVSAKELNLQVSPALDQQLVTATSAGTYNQEFQQALQSKLTAYQQTLQKAYTVTKGSNGRKLLQNSYHAAQLLLEQLNSPSS